MFADNPYTNRTVVTNRVPSAKVISQSTALNLINVTGNSQKESRDELKKAKSLKPSSSRVLYSKIGKKFS